MHLILQKERARESKWKVGEVGMIKEYVVKVTNKVLPNAFTLFEEEYSPELELIRCKDCKYCYYASNRTPEEQCYACTKIGIDVTAGWFCADGERKET